MPSPIARDLRPRSSKSACQRQRGVRISNGSAFGVRYRGILQMLVQAFDTLQGRNATHDPSSPARHRDLSDEGRRGCVAVQPGTTNTRMHQPTQQAVTHLVTFREEGFPFILPVMIKTWGEGSGPRAPEACCLEYYPPSCFIPYCQPPIFPRAGRTASSTGLECELTGRHAVTYDGNACASSHGRILRTW